MSDTILDLSTTTDAAETPDETTADTDTDTDTAADTKTTTIAEGEIKEGIGPASFGDEWRKDLTNDPSLLKRLERFDSPKRVLDWAVNAEKKLKENAPTTTLTPPSEGASEDEVKTWREAAGVPETPDKYEIKLSDGMELGEADQPIVDSYLAEAHKMGAPNNFVSGFMDWYLRMEREEQQGMIEDDDAHFSRSEQTLRDEWGPADYKRNVDAALRLFEGASEKVTIEGTDEVLAIEEAILGARMANGRKIGGDVETLRFLTRIGLELLPIGAEIPDGATAGALDDRLSEIRQLRRIDPQAYERDKKLQAEELQLIDARLKRERRNQAA